MIEQIKRDVELKLIGVDVSHEEVYEWLRYLVSEVENLYEVNTKLTSFAQNIFHIAFEGGSLDGGEIQDMGVKHGLLTETIYDPEKHGEESYAEPGDPWFVFSDVLTFPPAIDSTT